MTYTLEDAWNPEKAVLLLDYSVKITQQIAIVDYLNRAAIELNIDKSLFSLSYDNRFLVFQDPINIHGELLEQLLVGFSLCYEVIAQQVDCKDMEYHDPNLYIYGHIRTKNKTAKSYVHVLGLGPRIARQRPKDFEKFNEMTLLRAIGASQKALPLSGEFNWDSFSAFISGK